MSDRAYRRAVNIGDGYKALPEKQLKGFGVAIELGQLCTAICAVLFKAECPMSQALFFKRAHFFCGGWLAFFVLASAQAQLLIPAGGQISVATGVMDLSCADLTIAGTLNLSGGRIINVRTLTIESTGRLNGDAGQIELSGNWINNSVGGAGFVGGNSLVSFVDNAACATTSTLSGNTVFASLNLNTSVGKTYLLAAGSTQAVTAQLSLIGTPANALTLNSTQLNQFATLDVRGTSRVAELSANWIAATGAWLGIGAVNRNPSGVTQRMFGRGDVVQEVPTLSAWSLMLLVLLLAGASVKAMRSRS